MLPIRTLSGHSIKTHENIYVKATRMRCVRGSQEEDINFDALEVVPSWDEPEHVEEEEDEGIHEESGGGR